METFISLPIAKINKFIGNAKDKLVYVAPGILESTAEEIVKVTEDKISLKVDIVLDSDPEICRIGYGEINAVEKLLKSRINIRKNSGIRIGVLIVDDDAWMFTPTPLMVEKEPDNNIINSIRLTNEQVRNLLSKIVIDNSEPTEQDKVIQLYKNDKSKHEIGNQEYTKDDLSNAKGNLELCPPQKFDLARQVTVYSSYVQFVELNLIGCQLNRRTISIPSKLLQLSKNKKDQERLKATYKLINENSNLAARDINDNIQKIRRIYLRSLGERFGTVILKQKKNDFLKEIEKAKKDLDNFSEKINEKLEKELEKCRKELKKVLLPLIIKNPPEDLMGSILVEKPTKEIAEKYLDDEFNDIFPVVDELVSRMKIICDFKDVTYETLCDNEFQTAIRNAYPYIEWPKPMEEYKAAAQSK